MAIASPPTAPTPVPQVPQAPQVPQGPGAPTPLKPFLPGTAGTAGTGGTPGAPGTTAYAPGVNTYATNPQSDLRGQTITPGPMANRLGIANTYEQNWNAGTEPQYQADLRSATSQAAGAGQLGSGQLRTSLGNLAYNRDLQRNTAESNFLNNALGGSIDDAYRNIGIAQQQQGFQAGLQNQTFGQGLQALLAGNSGNPADTQLALSQMYGGQAGSAFASLPELFTSGTQAPAINANTQTLQQYLRGLGIGQGTAQPPGSTPPSAPPTSALGTGNGVGGALNNPANWVY